jgi:hypothetical protein
MQIYLLADDKATYFSIEYHNNYKVIENHKTGNTYVLVQCGTPAPTNVTNATEIYNIPITKAAAMETTVVPYLEVKIRNMKCRPSLLSILI